MPNKIRDMDGGTEDYQTDAETTATAQAAAADSTQPILEGAGDPNGSVSAKYGQVYQDTTNDVTYINISNPSPGTVWTVS